MEKARDDFEKRKLEIEKYFTFLNNVDKDKPVLHYEILGLSEQYKIDGELLKIFKANGFLLIYNLVESITRIALTEYLYAINDAKVPFDRLKDEVQKLWLKNRKFQEKKISNISEEDYLFMIHNEIVTNRILPFELEIKDKDGKVTKEFIEFSGNIDVRKINSVFEKYGILLNLNDDVKKQGSTCLHEVKMKRNDLAHGRTSFADSTKDCSVKQLCTYKDGALTYLEGMLTNIEECVKDGYYKSRS